MRVQFTRGCTWYDLRWSEGEIAELDQVIYDRLIRAGACVPAPEPIKQEQVIEEENGDNDIHTHQDGSIGESSDDSVSKDAPKRRPNRRNK